MGRIIETDNREEHLLSPYSSCLFFEKYQTGESSASGNGSIPISPDKLVTGSITVSGMEPTAAHIHEGAQRENGPVVIPLAKSSDNTWSVPAGAKLTDAQYESYLAGNLYVNVHSAANKGGEIRAQRSPKIT
jgi:hypothetical protein